VHNSWLVLLIEPFSNKKNNKVYAVIADVGWLTKFSYETSQCREARTTFRIIRGSNLPTCAHALFTCSWAASTQNSMQAIACALPQLLAMSASTFLALPAEIRNQIYELALTSPEPLRIHEAVKGAPIFNQLKHANKQLYAETAHLELMYNTLLVCAESWDEPPAQMLLGWLSSIPPPPKKVG
jgi:hypothetical protein